jgi:hypothetical protein
MKLRKNKGIFLKVLHTEEIERALIFALGVLKEKLPM